MTAEQWFYRVEGNNNVVFSNSNDSRILRLPKIRKRNRHSISVQSKNDIGREVEFLEHVASKIFKDVRVHLVVGEKLYLSKEFLAKLSEEMEGKRPKCYEDEELDDSTEYGLLLPNFCKLLLNKSSIISRFSFINAKTSTLPTISVELRPKSCYFPEFEIETCPEIKDMCFFCIRRMYETLKHPENLKTKYCPNDLYSGNSARTKRALLDLISSPERYLSIRVNDQDVFSHSLLQKRLSEIRFQESNRRYNRSVFDQTVSSLFGENGREAFLNVLCEALQTPVVTKRSDLINIQQNPHVVKPHCRRRKSKKEEMEIENNNCEPRNNSSVLALLSSIHAMRYLPLCKLIKLQGEVKSHLEVHEEDADLLSLESPYNAQLWKNVAKLPSLINGGVGNEQRNADCRQAVVEAAETLRQFMIGRSFGCCSLIITLQQVEQGDRYGRHFKPSDAELVTDGFGRTFLSSISIIDLYKDLLPAQVEKSYRREQDIITFVNNHFLKHGVTSKQ